MNEFSSNPWRWVPAANGTFNICCESGGFAPLARVKGDKRSTFKNAHANARLMAAAPVLLDALYDMLHECHDIEQTDAIADAVAKARYAIRIAGCKV